MIQKKCDFTKIGSNKYKKALAAFGENCLSEASSAAAASGKLI